MFSHLSLVSIWLINTLVLVLIRGFVLLESVRLHFILAYLLDTNSGIFKSEYFLGKSQILGFYFGSTSLKM